MQFILHEADVIKQLQVQWRHPTSNAVLQQREVEVSAKSRESLWADSEVLDFPSASGGLGFEVECKMQFKPSQVRRGGAQASS